MPEVMISWQAIEAAFNERFDKIYIKGSKHKLYFDGTKYIEGPADQWRLLALVDALHLFFKLKTASPKRFFCQYTALVESIEEVFTARLSLIHSVSTVEACGILNNVSLVVVNTSRDWLSLADLNNGLSTKCVSKKEVARSKYTQIVSHTMISLTDINNDLSFLMSEVVSCTLTNLRIRCLESLNAIKL